VSASSERGNDIDIFKEPVAVDDPLWKEYVDEATLSINAWSMDGIRFLM
jgi:hypothetical protein